MGSACCGRLHFLLWDDAGELAREIAKGKSLVLTSRRPVYRVALALGLPCRALKSNCDATASSTVLGSWEHVLRSLSSNTFREDVSFGAKGEKQ